MSASIRTCDVTPTPATQNILGTCPYYQWRYDDFKKRHKNCDHSKQPPDYYLSYGLKYCQRFSTIVYPLMGHQGKIVITKIRLQLQLKLETLLKTNPMIELNNEAFKDAVFATHPSAYEEGGVATLNPAEQVIIGLTPDPNTWLDPVARGQAKAIVEYIGEKEYGPALADPQAYFRFTTDVPSKKQRYLSKNKAFSIFLPKVWSLKYRYILSFMPYIS